MAPRNHKAPRLQKKKENRFIWPVPVPLTYNFSKRKLRLGNLIPTGMANIDPE